MNKEELTLEQINNKQNLHKSKLANRINFKNNPEQNNEIINSSEPYNLPKFMTITEKELSELSAKIEFLMKEKDEFVIQTKTRFTSNKKIIQSLEQREKSSSLINSRNLIEIKNLRNEFSKFKEDYDNLGYGTKEQLEKNKPKEQGYDNLIKISLLLFIFSYFISFIRFLKMTLPRNFFCKTDPKT